MEICDRIVPKWEDGQSVGLGKIEAAQATFAALAATCKYLNPFGMRYLYQTFQTRRFGYDTGFLRMISNHPELAPHVREVLVHRLVHCRSTSSKPNPSVSSSKTAEEIQKTPLPHRERFMSILPIHPEEVELALLIYNARDSLQRLEQIHPCRCRKVSHRLLSIVSSRVKARACRKRTNSLIELSAPLRKTVERVATCYRRFHKASVS